MRWRNPINHAFCLLALVHAGSAFGDSKLLATGGATQIEGQAGGGIVPWAVISGYGDTGEWGGAAVVTRVGVDDFTLDVAAVSVGANNRWELSYARQSLDVQPLDLTIDQDVFGAKWRLAGDLVFGELPQLTLGLQYKHNRDFTVPQSVGANSAEGVDVYLAASRLWLNGLWGRNVFANATVRRTEANQAGFLGFGAQGGADYDWVAEGTLGIFLDRYWAVGIEYRQKPDHLDAVAEDDWQDVWVGWFPSKRIAIVWAWSDLGDIAGLPDQRGWYMSLQVSE